MFIALSLICMLVSYISFSILFILMFGEIIKNSENEENFKNLTDADIHLIKKKMKIK